MNYREVFEMSGLIWKSVSIVLGLLIWMVTVEAAVPSLVIDHTSIEVGEIPLYWVEKVKRDQMLIQCVGQSHSYQYESGLLLLEQNNPDFAVEIAGGLDDLNAPNRLHILRYQFSSVYNKWMDDGDDKDYWATEEGRVNPLNSARQAVAEGRPIAASIWCWCWDICRPQSFFSISDEFTEEHIGWYLNAIEMFNQDPSVAPTAFVYHTSVSDCSDYINPDGPWRVTYFNEFIRQTARQANGILIDQADIENWNIDNTAQRFEVDADGRTVYLRHTDYDESNLPDTITGDHANDALCLRKASAIWYLAARLAGWNGCKSIQGDVNGDCIVDINDFAVLADVWLVTADSPNWANYADIDLQGGDGMINAFDFAVLSDAWLKASCENTYASDLNNNCKVEMGDLILFAESWVSSPGDDNWNEKANLSVNGDLEVIDYADFSVFNSQWLSGNCINSFASDFNGDCRISFEDLQLFTDNWLLDSVNDAYDPKFDIMPPEGDGKINLLDFSLLAAEWLK